MLRAAIAAIATAFLSAPALSQTAEPPAAAATRAPQPESEEKPIGAEAFAEDPTVDLTATRGTFGPAQMTFRIATWHLGAKTAKAAEKAGTRQQAEPASSWRHTFGSERRTARWRELAEAGFAADIVALQGVTSAGDARRLFPARRYHVVVSRQLLARSNAGSTGIAVFRNDAPETTALAYRRQRGVRLAGFRHFLPETAARSNEPEAAAITAFRLRIYGKLIWVASIDVGDDCKVGDERPLCQGGASVLAAFKDWLGQLKDGPSPLVLLGRWPNAAVKMIDAAGFGVTTVRADTSAGCSPQASGAMLAMPVQARALKTELAAQATPAGGTACAHLAKVTVHLRESD